MFLTLSVENMTQGKLFHGNGRDNHGQSFLLGHIRPLGGKEGIDILNSIVRRRGPGPRCAAGYPCRRLTL